MARDALPPITGLPTDPRITGGLPAQLISGFSDLGRQATNPQWQYPEVFNPKINYTWVVGKHSLKTGYEFQHIQTEVQDVNPLYGRDEYSGRFSRPVGSTSTDNRYNLADFMLGLRSTYFKVRTVYDAAIVAKSRDGSFLKMPGRDTGTFAVILRGEDQRSASIWNEPSHRPTCSCTRSKVGVSRPVTAVLATGRAMIRW